MKKQKKVTIDLKRRRQRSWREKAEAGKYAGRKSKEKNDILPETETEDAKREIFVEKQSARRESSSRREAKARVYKRDAAGSSYAGPRISPKKKGRRFALFSLGKGGSSAAWSGGGLLAFAFALPLLISLAIVIIMCGAAAMTADADPAYAYIDTEAASQIRMNVVTGWNEDLRDMRSGAVMSGVYDSVTVAYNESETGDTDGSRISNWDDVMAVWIAKNERKLELKDESDVRGIYYVLNPMELKEIPKIKEDGTEALDARIHVKNLRYNEADTGMSAEESERAGELLRGGNYELLRVACGEKVNVRMSSYMPPPFVSGAAAAALTEAARHEGFRYSNSLRMSEGYDDCSSLVWKCCMAAGCDLGDPDYAPTAASIAKWCEGRNCLVSEKDIQPGDLIFWGNDARHNGRYRNIYHTAIYAGDGLMWEAAPSAGGVVLREVTRQRPKDILCYARPYAV